MESVSAYPRAKGGTGAAVGAWDKLCSSKRVHMPSNQCSSALLTACCVFKRPPRCAYHAWRFDSDGKCLSIPQSERGGKDEAQDRACVKHYPTQVESRFHAWDRSDPCSWYASFRANRSLIYMMIFMARRSFGGTARSG